MTSSGHAHLDRQRYDMACHEWRPTLQKIWEYVPSSLECTGHGNDFELIPTVKMETRNPVISVSKFRRCVIIAELWRPEVARR